MGGRNLMRNYKETHLISMLSSELHLLQVKSCWIYAGQLHQMHLLVACCCCCWREPSCIPANQEKGSSFLHLLSKMSSNCWQTFLTLTLFRACLQSCGGQYAVSVQHMNKDPCFCVPPGPSIWRPWDTSGFQPWQDQMGMVKSAKVNHISNKSWLLS